MAVAKTAGRRMSAEIDAGRLVSLADAKTARERFRATASGTAGQSD